MDDGFLELGDSPSEVEFLKQKIERLEQERDLAVSTAKYAQNNYKTLELRYSALADEYRNALTWIEEHQGKAAKILVREAGANKGVKRGDWDLKKQKKARR